MMNKHMHTVGKGLAAARAATTFPLPPTQNVVAALAAARSNTTTLTTPISLGIFTYLNIQPVYYGLLHEQDKQDDINLVLGVPTRLNAALLGGEVDLSSVSGYAYAE